MLASTRTLTRCCLNMAKACAPPSSRLCRASPCHSASSRTHTRFTSSYVCFSPALLPRQQPHQCAPSTRPALHRCLTAAASPGEAGTAAPSLVDRLKSDMKDAMKAKDQARLDAIRFLNAAIKQREIDLRESGATMSDPEVIKVIQKLVKQRRDSIDSYRAGGRDDLVAKEQAELSLLEGYLPVMMSAEEVKQMVAQLVSELGLAGAGMRGMGPLVKAATERSGGRADAKTVSEAAKAALQGR